MSSDFDKKSESVRIQTIQFYSKSVTAAKSPNEAVRFATPYTQWLRFARLTKDIPLHVPTTSVLDIGCGNGELFQYLVYNGFQGQYEGWDISPDLLHSARSRFPDVQFNEQDITMTPVTKSEFDYVVANAIFNLDFGQDQTYVHEALSNMFLLSKVATSLNFISAYARQRDAGMFYVSVPEVVNYAVKKLTPHLTLEHGIPEYGSTLTLFKYSFRRRVSANHKG